MTVTAPSILEVENAKLRAALRQILDTAEWQHQLMVQSDAEQDGSVSDQDWKACVSCAPAAFAIVRRTLEGL